MAQEKSKYWCAVLYPESMPSDWQDIIADLFQVPCAYCIHDKDKDGHDGDRKTHVHIILAFNNTTTYNHVLSIVRLLMASCSTVKKVINIRYMFDYLIHDTDSCKKANKYLYDVSERILINNFDIGAYEQRSLEDKREDARLLKKYIYKYRLENNYELDIHLDSDPDIDDDLRQRFEEAEMSYNAYIKSALQGCYHYNQKVLHLLDTTT